jgi:hypothetical protein
MTKKNFYVCALALGALATITLAATLTLSLSRFHRGPTPPVNSPMVAQATRSTAAESSGGPKEGIKVHGYWTIEVRNPDGKLVTHREFENALQDNGAKSLALILGRQKTVQFWFVQLLPDAADPTANAWEPGFGQMMEPISEAQENSRQFKNLTVTVPTGIDANGNHIANANQVILMGNATTLSAGKIGRVQTVLSSCPASFLPGVVCTGENSFAVFTFATLAVPVTVSAGQIVQVTVVISFS